MTLSTALTSSRERFASEWRQPLISLAVLVAALLFLFSDTALSMVTIWNRSGNFTHAFLVAPISLWLMWRQRATLTTLSPRASPPALGLMLLAAIAWQLGNVVAVNAVVHFALVSMLVLTVPVVLGWQVARALTFPLLFLFFAVPFGEFLTPVLMRYTADFTVTALRFTGVPVFREGQQFTIPSGRWSVIEACSGIRYLMASFMVGSLFAYLNYRSTRRRLLFVTLSLLVPILANWLRAYMIVMLGHLSNNKIATGVDHIVYGWVFFGVVIFALFVIGARWAEPEPTVTAPNVDMPLLTKAGLGRQGVAAACAVLALLLTQVPGWLLPQATAVNTQATVLQLPAQLGDWTSVASPTIDWTPSFAGPSASAWRFYRQTNAAGTSGVGVHLLYYRQQSESRKLVSSVNQMAGSEDPKWNALHVDGRPAQLPLHPGLVWQRTVLLENGEASAGRQRLTVWRAYWIGGPLTGGDLAAKLLQASQRVRGQPDDSAAVILVTDERDDAVADRLLAHFAAEQLPAVLAVLQDAARR